MGRHHDRRVRRGRAWPRFAPTWRRPTSPGAARPPTGSAAYFRIQGPTLVIEYAPQGGVDHIHTIYRDPTNDYGAKIRREIAGSPRSRSSSSPAASASAHRRDEYLQAARVAIDPDRVADRAGSDAGHRGGRAGAGGDRSRRQSIDLRRRGAGLSRPGAARHGCRRRRHAARRSSWSTAAFPRSLRC